ncbi:MAG: HTH domain-containing protein, partial [Raoultibacter sp.]
MTATQLSRELEVSTRTIRRDIEALSGAGVPVYMTRGKGGGIHLLDNYVLDKSLVSESEQDEILAALSALGRTGAVDDDEVRNRLARLFQRE